MRLLIFEASRHATVVTISLLHCSCIEGKGLPHITSGCTSSAQQAFFSAIPLPSLEDQKKNARRTNKLYIVMQARLRPWNRK